MGFTQTYFSAKLNAANLAAMITTHPKSSLRLFHSKSELINAAFFETS